jgi:hypothetical protein
MAPVSSTGVLTGRGKEGEPIEEAGRSVLKRNGAKYHKIDCSDGVDFLW